MWAESTRRKIFLIEVDENCSCAASRLQPRSITTPLSILNFADQMLDPPPIMETLKSPRIRVVWENCPNHQGHALGGHLPLAALGVARTILHYLMERQAMR